MLGHTPRQQSGHCHFRTNTTTLIEQIEKKRVVQNAARGVGRRERADAASRGTPGQPAKHLILTTGFFFKAPSPHLVEGSQRQKIVFWPVSQIFLAPAGLFTTFRENRYGYFSVAEAVRTRL